MPQVLYQIFAHISIAGLVPVLIIDLDMNHGATRHFGVEPEAFLGAFEMLVGAEAAENLVLTSADREEGVSLPEGLDLIPVGE